MTIQQYTNTGLCSAPSPRLQVYHGSVVPRRFTSRSWCCPLCGTPSCAERCKCTTKTYQYLGGGPEAWAPPKTTSHPNWRRAGTFQSRVVALPPAPSTTLCGQLLATIVKILRTQSMKAPADAEKAMKARGHVSDGQRTRWRMHLAHCVWICSTKCCGALQPWPPRHK